MTTPQGTVDRALGQLGDLTEVEKELESEFGPVRQRAIIRPPTAEEGTAAGGEWDRKYEKVLEDGKSALSKVRAKGKAAKLTAAEAIGLEAVIHIIGRPALFVVNGVFARAPGQWHKLLEPERASIEKTMRSVGRIECEMPARTVMVGTGFLVSDDLVMTNRHVVENIASMSRKGRAAWRFTSGMIPKINYRRERGEKPKRGGHEPRSFTISSIEFVSKKPGPDLALLRVSRQSESGAGLPGPLTLASDVDAKSLPGRVVYVVGYPLQDQQGATPPKVLRDIFRDVYGVKRLQPGEVMDASRKTFSHDCSTLGGNSGSCVLDLADNRVIGLHFQGQWKAANDAVSLWTLKKDRTLVRLNLNFD